MKRKRPLPMVTVLAAMLASLGMLAREWRASGAAAGATYYVARNGNDGNPGSEAQPWLTVSKAASVAGPGDTVLVRAGTYDEKLRFANGGTEDAYITYRPYRDDQVTIAYSGVDDHVVLFTKPYIVFEGFKINSVKFQPVRLNPGSHHVVIRNCELTGAATQTVTCPKCGEKIIQELSRLSYHGLLIESDEVHHVTIQNCRIHGHGQRKGHHGMYIKGDYHLIEGNTIYNNAEYGIHLYNNEGSVKHCIVRNNVLYGNGVDLATGGSGIIVTQGGNQIYNNVCYGNGRYGIIVWHVPAGDPPNEIYNNVLYGNGRSGLVIDASSNTIAKNNVIANNRERNLAVLGSSKTTLDYNCYWPDGEFWWAEEGQRPGAPVPGVRGQPVATRGRGEAGEGAGQPGGFAAYKARSAQDAHSICQDPRLVNADKHDFHLRDDSPCVDAGTAVSITHDCEGKKRPMGGGFDIGAYER